MTFLGRVFTGLVAVFSVAFFLLALVINATHTKWRDAVMDPNSGYRAKIKVYQDRIRAVEGALEDKNKELAQEQAARRGALAALQTQLAEASKELGTKEGELRDLQGAHTLLNSTHATTTADLARVTEENAFVKQRISETIAQRDGYLVKVTDLTNSVQNLKSLEEDLTNVVTDLRNSSTITQARLDNALSQMKLVGMVEDPEDSPPEGLNGEVKAVGNNGLVEVSLGTDDGLHVGHQMDIFRGSQYLGRILIKKANDDASIGQVLPGFRAGPVQPRDKVVPKAGLR